MMTSRRFKDQGLSQEELYAKVAQLRKELQKGLWGDNWEDEGYRL
jgi:hypothetical protein